MTKLVLIIFGIGLVAESGSAQVYRRAIPQGPVMQGPRDYVDIRRVPSTAVTPASSQAVASTRTGAEVLTRPTLIRSSGAYILGGNIYAGSDATTAAIVISAPDVTLDLAGFTVVGCGATAADAVGIAILADRVTVRNGSVTNFNAENQCSIIVGAGVRSFLLADLRVAGSDTGILLNPDNLDDNPVQGGLIDRCSVDGGSVGILGFASQGVTVRNCIVSGAAARRQVPGEGSGLLLRGSSYIVEGCNVSGSTHGLRLDADFSLVKGCSLSANRNTGAYITGRGNQVQDCEISGNGIGGLVVLGDSCSFVNDHVTGNGGHGISLDKSGETGANHTFIQGCAVVGNSGDGISDKGLGDTKVEGGNGQGAAHP